MSNIYYVYILLDPRFEGTYTYGSYSFNHKPFYVGKGCKNRAEKHLKDLNNEYPKTRKIKKILAEDKVPIIHYFKDRLYENEAYDLEKEVIRNIGLDNLTNILSGGIGISSEDVKGIKNPMYGKRRSQELLDKMNSARKATLRKYKGMKLEEILGEEKAILVKAKLSIARKGKSWEQKYGIEKANKIREKFIKNRTGKIHSKESIEKMKISASLVDRSHKKEEALKRWELQRLTALDKTSEVIELLEKNVSKNKIMKLLNISRHYIQLILKNLMNKSNESISN